MDATTSAPSREIKFLTNRKDAVTAKLLKLNARAQTHNLIPARFTMTDAWEEVTIGVDDHTEIVLAEVTSLTFDNALVGYGDWEFIATIEHLTDTENIVRAVPGTEHEIPNYLHTSSAGRCDHCGVRRSRNDTFYIGHVDGSTKIVGRKCLADFLGHDALSSVWGILRAFEKALNAIDDDFDRDLTSRHIDEGVDRRDFLAMVNAVIRKHGWKSKGAAADHGGEATAEITWRQITRRDSIKPKYIISTEDNDFLIADEAINAVKKIDTSDGASDYEHNLKLIIEQPTILYKHAGYAASAINYTQLQKQRNAEREQAAVDRKASEYIGQIGDRIELSVTVKLTKTIENDWGTKTLIKLEDESGNQLTWWASASWAEWLEVGDTPIIRATVKEHKEYRGVAETVVSHANMIGGTYHSASGLKTA